MHFACSLLQSECETPDRISEMDHNVYQVGKPQAVSLAPKCKRNLG